MTFSPLLGSVILAFALLGAISLCVLIYLAVMTLYTRKDDAE